MEALSEMTREEQWLGAIQGMDGVQAPDMPVWHYEQMLAAIYDAVVGASPAREFPARSWHLDEILYAVYCAVAGLDDPGCPAPTCRIEEFWYGIYGRVMGDESASVPTPVWRIEEFLAGVFDAAAEWGGGTEQTVTGNLPLILQNALSHAILSLTRYGLCTQDGTPTPDAPVDIMCNNGALKVSPNLLDPSESNIVIGESISVQGPPATAANNWRTDYIPVVGGKTYIFYGRRKADNVISAYNRMNFYAADKTFISPRPSYEQNTPIVATAPSNAAYVRLSSAPYNSQNPITRDTFDAFNWIFAAASSEIPYVPYGVVYAGGTHPGQNLVDLTAVTDDYYYDQNGVYTALANARLTDYIYVKSGQKYTVYVKAQRAGVAANVRCNLFDSAKVWKSQTTFSVNSGSEAVGVITPSEDGYLRVSANYAGTGAQADWSTLQIVRGEYTLATMPPYEPYIEIPYTPEVLTVMGGNLFDASSYTEINAYVNANTGVLMAGTSGSLTQYCAVIPCKPNTQYNITGQGASAWGAFTTDSIGTTATAFIKGGILTTGANDRYLIGLVRANGDSIDYRNTLVVQETQTVTDIPMLLGVGGYKDAAELIQGIKTGRVGVKVFDGTEVWASYSGGNCWASTAIFGKLSGNTQSICTHYVWTRSVPASMENNTIALNGTTRVCVKDDRFTTDKEVSAFFADQYARGTPVILVYPKATETTEQITPHNLVTHKGVNIVDSTANVGPVEAEVV